MTARAAALVALALFVGSTLVLSELRWFRRRPLVDRLAPYVPGARPPGGGVRSCRRRRSDRSSPRSPGRWASRAGPLRRDRVAGRSPRAGALAARRHRVPGAPAGLGGGRAGGRRRAGRRGAPVGTGGAGLRPRRTGPGVPGGRAAARHGVGRWRRRIFLELPVVSEQLGMLLGAGYSLGAALSRPGRSAGACGATWCG